MPVAIVGAGIGGLTTGLILRQKGFQVQIYESADQIRPVGAGIAMANNAMQIFETLGLAEKIANAGHRISKMRITDSSLKDLSVANLKNFERKYGVSNVAIHRGALQRILAESLGSGQLSLSKKLVDVRNEGDYRLSFEDGTHAKTKVLIGADGIRSTVRQKVLGKGSVKFSGQRCWRGVCKDPFGLKYSGDAVEVWGRGKRFGFVKIDENTLYWYAVINEKTVVGSGLELLFSDFHPDILTMIRQTPPSQVYFSEINELETLQHWSLGNVCLIGDAAHAMTPNMGQGACQAVEDAYLLGAILDDATSFQSGFEAYYRVRRKKVREISLKSRVIGRVAQVESHFGSWLRNTLLKAMPNRMMEKELAGVFEIADFKKSG